MNNSQLQTDFNEIVKYCATTKSSDCDTVFRFCKSAKIINPLLIQRLQLMLTDSNNEQQKSLTKGDYGVSTECNNTILKLIVIAMSDEFKARIYFDCYDAYTTGNKDFVISDNISVVYMHTNLLTEVKNFKVNVINKADRIKSHDEHFSLLFSVRSLTDSTTSCYLDYNVINQTFIGDFKTGLNESYIQTSDDDIMTSKIVDYLNMTLNLKQLKLLSSMFTHYQTSHTDKTIVLLDNNDKIQSILKYIPSENNTSQNIFKISCYTFPNNKTIKYDIAFDNFDRKFVKNNDE